MALGQAIGTGIGGFMSGAESGANNVLTILGNLQKLQQARKEQQARALITQTLGAAPAAGFGGGIGNIANGTPQPAPPMPGQPSTPAPAPQQQPGANPYYPALANPPQTRQPQQPQPQNPAASPIVQESIGPEGTGMDEIIPGSPVNQPQQPLSSGPAAGAPASLGGGDAGATSQPPAAAPQTMAGANEGDLIVTDPKTGQSFNFSKMLHPQSLEDIVKRIKQRRPDADDETVEMAAEKLYTLANQGDKIQQVGALATLKYLGLDTQIASREKIAGEQIAGRAANVATQQSGAMARTEAQQEGANQREQSREAASASRGQAIQDRIDARFNQSMKTRQLSMQQKQQATMVANSYKNIMTQLAAVKDQIAMGVPTPQQQAQLQALQEQAVKLYAQLRGMGLAIDTPNALLTGNEEGKEVPIQPAASPAGM